jgi:hypothetical protein
MIALTQLLKTVFTGRLRLELRRPGTADTARATTLATGYLRYFPDERQQDRRFDVAPGS